MNHPLNPPVVFHPPAAGPPGLGDGMRALFGGFGFLFTNPGVWIFALVPVAIALSLFGMFGWLALATVPSGVDSLFGAPTTTAGGIVASVLTVAAVVAVLLVAALVSFGLAQPLSGPALERIVRRVEKKLGAPTWPPTSIFDDMLRSLQSVIVGYAFGLPLLAVLVGINIVFPPAVVVTFPLKIAVMAMLLTWDFCDYPLSIRGVAIGTRVAFLRRHLRPVIGFGIGLALLSLLPCALLIVLPAGVAGAARLIVTIERWESSQGVPPPYPVA